MTEDRDLAEALRGLAQSTLVPPSDPDRERALLEAFDAASERKRSAPPVARWRPAAAAALVARQRWRGSSRAGPVRRRHLRANRWRR